MATADIGKVHASYPECNDEGGKTESHKSVFGDEAIIEGDIMIPLDFRLFTLFYFFLFHSENYSKKKCIGYKDSD